MVMVNGCTTHVTQGAGEATGTQTAGVPCNSERTLQQTRELTIQT